jgi:hypothetical protein
LFRSIQCDRFLVGRKRQAGHLTSLEVAVSQADDIVTSRLVGQVVQAARPAQILLQEEDGRMAREVAGPETGLRMEADLMQYNGGSGSGSVAAQNVRLDSGGGRKMVYNEPDAALCRPPRIQADLHAQGQIPYSELAAATGGFDPSRKIGEGGFGSVFRGLWNHTEVAVKRLEQAEELAQANGTSTAEQLLNEV